MNHAGPYASRSTAAGDGHATTSGDPGAGPQTALEAAAAVAAAALSSSSRHQLAQGARDYRARPTEQAAAALASMQHGAASSSLSPPTGGGPDAAGAYSYALEPAGVAGSMAMGGGLAPPPPPLAPAPDPPLADETGEDRGTASTRGRKKRTAGEAPSRARQAKQARNLAAADPANATAQAGQVNSGAGTGRASSQDGDANSNDADGDGDPNNIAMHNGRPLMEGKRAEQNRQAQRAFRQRRDARMKELEQKEKVLDRTLIELESWRRSYEGAQAVIDELRRQNEMLERAVLSFGGPAAAAAAAAGRTGTEDKHASAAAPRPGGPVDANGESAATAPTRSAADGASGTTSAAGS